MTTIENANLNRLKSEDWDIIAQQYHKCPSKLGVDFHKRHQLSEKVMELIFTQENVDELLIDFMMEDFDIIRDGIKEDCIHSKLNILEILKQCIANSYNPREHFNIKLHTRKIT